MSLVRSSGDLSIALPSGAADLLTALDPFGTATGPPAGPVTLTSLPRKVDIHTTRGDDFLFRLTVTDPDGQPVDLSAVQVEAHIRRAPDDGVLAGAFAVSTDENHIALRLHHDTSAGLPLRAVWDCQVVLGADGWVVTIVAGSLTLTPDVTRA